MEIAKRIIDTKKGTDYIKVFAMAAELSSRGAFALIIDCLDYVRNTYNKPSV